MSTTTWFNAANMKTMATVIVAFDIVLLLAWLSGAAYLAFYLETACFHTVSIFHFLIVVHFILGIHLSTMIVEISKEQRLHLQRYSKPLGRLPYYLYEPLPWILTSMVSFCGDLILLTWGIIDYKHENDECNAARIMHITFDTVALLTSVISIIWFIVFAFYCIREERGVLNV